MHNMRSLNLDKFNELKLIAANYDIIAITKSWLTAEKEQLYNLDNFTPHHCHRRKKRIGWGVAVYIRSHLNVQKLKTNICQLTGFSYITMIKHL